MPLSLADAILRTVCYADIFDYPLTLPEIRKYLIGAKYSQGKERELKKKADSIPQISRKSDFYFLKGKDVIVNYRKRREYFSSQKMIKSFINNQSNFSINLIWKFCLSINLSF